MPKEDKLARLLYFWEKFFMEWVKVEENLTIAKWKIPKWNSTLYFLAEYESIEG